MVITVPKLIYQCLLCKKMGCSKTYCRRLCGADYIYHSWPFPRSGEYCACIDGNNTDVMCNTRVSEDGAIALIVFLSLAALFCLCALTAIAIQYVNERSRPISDGDVISNDGVISDDSISGWGSTRSDRSRWGNTKTGKDDSSLEMDVTRV